MASSEFVRGWTLAEEDYSRGETERPTAKMLHESASFRDGYRQGWQERVAARMGIRPGSQLGCHTRADGLVTCTD